MKSNMIVFWTLMISLAFSGSSKVKEDSLTPQPKPTPAPRPPPQPTPGPVHTPSFTHQPTLEDLKRRFSKDFAADVADRDIRIDIRANNWFRVYHKKLILQNDLSKADVKTEDFRAMQIGQKPLGFDSVNEYQEFQQELAALIQAETKTNKFRIILSGTSTTFYSENPQKAGQFFDMKGKHASDMDVAVEFEDLNVPKNVSQKNFNPQQAIRDQQVSQMDTFTYLDLNSAMSQFHRKWGSHAHAFMNTLNVKTTKLKREIGIVFLKKKWKDIPSSSESWKRSFCYNAENAIFDIC